MTVKGKKIKISTIKKFNATILLQMSIWDGNESSQYGCLSLTNMLRYLCLFIFFLQEFNQTIMVMVYWPFCREKLGFHSFQEMSPPSSLKIQQSIMFFHIFHNNLTMRCIVRIIDSEKELSFLSQTQSWHTKKSWKQRHIWPLIVLWLGEGGKSNIIMF